MKINSELPNCMLSKNNELNEYDFVLFHLYITNDIYRRYYLNQRLEHPDRLMILDNSAYEFYIKGEELNLEEFYKVIIELKPDLYILPDTLMDKDKTIRNTIDFMNMYGTNIKQQVGSNPLAVAQGKTFEDISECLDIYKDLGIINIAIPFHNSCFKEHNINDSHIGLIIDVFKKWHNVKHINEDMMYAIGRIRFISKFHNKLMEFNHVHLLGSHDPLEKFVYKLLFLSQYISTMDTGYPVKCALSGWELGKEISKPNVIIDEFLDKDISHLIQCLIEKNINIFKGF